MFSEQNEIHASTEFTHMQELNGCIKNQIKFSNQNF